MLSGLVVMLAAPAGAQKVAPPLPPPTGDVVYVSNITQLRSAVSNLVSGRTIMVDDGTYLIDGSTLVVGSTSGGAALQNIAIRGASGNRDAVILANRGMSTPSGGNNIFTVRNVQNFLIADMTLKDTYHHLIQIQSEQRAYAPHLYNLHLIDSGEQFVKVSTADWWTMSTYCDEGVVEYCFLEFTDRARHWYTHGIDALAVADWIIRDNTFLRIRGPEGVLTGGAILMWKNCLDTIVERNEFIECDFGVSLGLYQGANDLSRDGETVYDHQGGIVRNNFFFRAGLYGDVAVNINDCHSFKVYNNTAVFGDAYPWSVFDYRGPATSGEFYYNITDGPIRARTDATGTLVGNLTDADAHPEWFVDFANGDLHLSPAATAAIDQATTLAGVDVDYDGDTRPAGSAPDIGADEYLPPLPMLLASEPPADGTLPKTQNNLILCTFDTSITLPASGNPLVIKDMTNGCADVSDQFVYAIDPDDPNGCTLEARETDPNDPNNHDVLPDLTWYQIQSAPSWTAVAPFQFEVCTLAGDCNSSGRVTTADYSGVKAALGGRGDLREDLNGSARVTMADYSVVKATVRARAPTKPALCP